MIDRVIKKMNQWGEITEIKEYGRKLTFLNRTKEEYNWDNYELHEKEGLLKDEDGPLTDIPAELPGTEIEIEQTGPEHAVEEETTSDCSEKLHLQSYLEMLWSKTGYLRLLGNRHILYIILLYLMER